MDFTLEFDPEFDPAEEDLCFIHILRTRMHPAQRMITPKNPNTEQNRTIIQTGKTLSEDPGGDPGEDDPGEDDPGGDGLAPDPGSPDPGAPDPVSPDAESSDRNLEVKGAAFVNAKVAHIKMAKG